MDFKTVFIGDTFFFFNFVNCRVLKVYFSSKMFITTFTSDRLYACMEQELIIFQRNFPI